MSKKVNNLGSKIDVKHSAGTKTTCMKDYMQPSFRNAPNHFTLHVGNNDLDFEKTAESIANTILDHPTPLRNDQHDVITSNIILRAYNTNLNEKSVKKHVKKKGII